MLQSKIVQQRKKQTLCCFVLGLMHRSLGHGAVLGSFLVIENSF